MIGYVGNAASSQAFRGHCSMDSLRDNPIPNLIQRSTIQSRASSKLQQRKIISRSSTEQEQTMKQTMQLGMIGLGRMGANMVRRLIKDGHECVVFDRSQGAVKELVKEKAIGAG